MCFVNALKVCYFIKKALRYDIYWHVIITNTTSHVWLGEDENISALATII